MTSFMNTDINLVVLLYFLIIIGIAWDGALVESSKPNTFEESGLSPEDYYYVEVSEFYQTIKCEVVEDPVFPYLLKLEHFWNNYSVSFERNHVFDWKIPIESYDSCLNELYKVREAKTNRFVHKTFYKPERIPK